MTLNPTPDSFPSPNNVRKKPSSSRNLNDTLSFPITPIPGERKAAYKAACLLVWEMGHHLDRGEHLRIAGRFCTTLDQAILALLEIPT